MPNNSQIRKKQTSDSRLSQLEQPFRHDLKIPKSRVSSQEHKGITIWMSVSPIECSQKKKGFQQHTCCNYTNYHMGKKGDSEPGALKNISDTTRKKTPGGGARGAWRCSGVLRTVVRRSASLLQTLPRHIGSPDQVLLSTTYMIFLYIYIYTSYMVCIINSE